MSCLLQYAFKNKSLCFRSCCYLALSSSRKWWVTALLLLSVQMGKSMHMYTCVLLSLNAYLWISSCSAHLSVCLSPCLSCHYLRTSAMTEITPQSVLAWGDIIADSLSDLSWETQHRFCSFWYTGKWHLFWRHHWNLQHRTLTYNV